MRKTPCHDAVGASSTARNARDLFTPAWLLRGLACLSMCVGATAIHANPIYDPGNLSFSTTGQSMWSTGAATQFADSRFVGTQWSNRTAGVGGSMLSIGSAAGVALMGLARGAYTFGAHLRWSWAVLLGYAAGVGTHLVLNRHLF